MKQKQPEIIKLKNETEVEIRFPQTYGTEKIRVCLTNRNFPEDRNIAIAEPWGNSFDLAYKWAGHMPVIASQKNVGKMLDECQLTLGWAKGDMRQRFCEAVTKAINILRKQNAQYFKEKQA